ncbi:hypothetical protein FGE12_28645 [Aggregicoccus sp. 17bor-14]|uniref:hypothetical protein n=1 Tax=Myxococcaceae TaxID=31 RepID=UPI00129CC08D|nr:MULTISPECIES: hypothetical protein [Myxococcaceae]MBF5046417.1 hypothetical protein [Simulacricoccus sp. 17bor-14]MRI92136.1 hypothetical protein [Aggregicoccus sp. 17bor-14]
MHASAAPLAEAPTLPAASAAVPWTRLHRVGFRFTFSYLLLYLAPSPVDMVPGLGPLFEAYGHLWEWGVQRVGVGLLHLPAPIPNTPSGSGDRLFDWVWNLSVLLLALLATLAWSLVDERRRDAPRAYPRAAAFLRVYLRYALATILLGYGLVKVFALQMPAPDVARLTSTYGESSPMGLLWTFIGASTGYQMFCGAAETLAGLLLLFRRTTLLGALLAAGAMANVVALNYFYDVPVKLYSSNLLLFSLLLVLPDLRRLVDVLLLQRAVAAPPPLRTPFADCRVEWASRGLKALVVGGLLVLMVKGNVERRATQGAVTPELAPLQGLWKVQAFEASGVEAATPPWGELAVGPYRTGLRAADGTYWRYGMKVEKGTLTLASALAPKQAPLTWAQPDPEHLVLERPGLRVRLERQSPQFLLTTRGFHWVSEVPYNR